jgi:hypothetical protein
MNVIKYDIYVRHGVYEGTKGCRSRRLSCSSREEEQQVWAVVRELVYLYVVPLGEGMRLQ